MRDRLNLLATLMFSHGVPMLLAGDEFGRTQRGNNNAYCQDNEISWLDWQAADTSLVEFVRSLIRLRRDNPVFKRGEFLAGSLQDQGALYDVLWLTEHGMPMQIADWHDATRRALAILYRGDLGAEKVGPRLSLSGRDTAVLINGSDEALEFGLPPPPGGGHWELALDTADPDRIRGTRYRAQPLSVVLLLGSARQ